MLPAPSAPEVLGAYRKWAMPGTLFIFLYSPADAIAGDKVADYIFGLLGDIFDITFSYAVPILFRNVRKAILEKIENG